MKIKGRISNSFDCPIVSSDVVLRCQVMLSYSVVYILYSYYLTALF